jgi:metal-sulfur cluster biosynthetic enzyme
VIPEDEGATATPDALRERLRGVVDPCSAAAGGDLDVVEMGLIESVTVDEGAVTVSMRLTSPGCMMVEYFARRIDEVLGPVDGVESVALETDAGFDWHRGLMEERAREQRAARRRELRERYGDEVDRGRGPAGATAGSAPPSGGSPSGTVSRGPATRGDRDDGD